jgi:uncharacterized integral membrane protein
MLTAIGLTPGGSSTVHIYTQTVHRTTQLTPLVGRLSGIRTHSINKIHIMYTFFLIMPAEVLGECTLLYSCFSRLHFISQRLSNLGTSSQRRAGENIALVK